MHCPISFGIKCKNRKNENRTLSENENNKSKYKWDPKKCNIFQENLNRGKKQEINTELDALLKMEIDSIYEQDISRVIEKIETIFREAKETTFTPTSLRNKTGGEKNKKPWYDNECNKAKKNFSAARKRKNKSEAKRHGNFYKKQRLFIKTNKCFQS